MHSHRELRKQRLSVEREQIGPHHEDFTLGSRRVDRDERIKQDVATFMDQISNHKQAGQLDNLYSIFHEERCTILHKRSIGEKGSIEAYTILNDIEKALRQKDNTSFEESCVKLSVAAPRNKLLKKAIRSINTLSSAEMDRPHSDSQQETSESKTAEHNQEKTIGNYNAVFSPQWETIQEFWNNGSQESEGKPVYKTFDSQNNEWQKMQDFLIPGRYLTHIDGKHAYIPLEVDGAAKEILGPQYLNIIRKTRLGKTLYNWSMRIIERPPTEVISPGGTSKFSVPRGYGEAKDYFDVNIGHEGSEYGIPYNSFKSVLNGETISDRKKQGKWASTNLPLRETKKRLDTPIIWTKTSSE
jgi:hypothetical protein